MTVCAGATSWTSATTSAPWTASTWPSSDTMRSSVCWRTSVSASCWRSSTSCRLSVSTDPEVISECVQRDVEAQRSCWCVGDLLCCSGAGVRGHVQERRSDASQRRKQLRLRHQRWEELRVCVCVCVCGCVCVNYRYLTWLCVYRWDSWRQEQVSPHRHNNHQAGRSGWQVSDLWPLLPVWRVSVPRGPL